MGLELGTGPTCDPLVRGKASGMLEKNIGFGGSTDRIIGESKRERERQKSSILADSSTRTCGSQRKVSSRFRKQ